MTDPSHQLSDQQALAAVRQGDLSAFGVLHERHSAGALAYAKHCTRSDATARDVLADSFLSILELVKAGKGPTDAFKPYLLRTIRNRAMRVSSAEHRLVPTEDRVLLDTVVEFHDPLVADSESKSLWAAFQQLSPRDQTILWHALVERHANSRTAEIVGVSPNNVSVLVGRAKERLRFHYLRTHADGPD